jgi:hypothetical protein
LDDTPRIFCPKLWKEPVVRQTPFRFLLQDVEFTPLGDAPKLLGNYQWRMISSKTQGAKLPLPHRTEGPTFRPREYMSVYIFWAAGSPSGTILVEENHHASNEVWQNRLSLTPVYNGSGFYFGHACTQTARNSFAQPPVGMGKRFAQKTGKRKAPVDRSLPGRRVTFRTKSP